jgi:hypothetical protein
MGCDIHCYVEYQKSDYPGWRDFGGRVNPGRDYSLFGRLAGVRSGPALVEPRGIPGDLAWAARDDWFLFISESGGGDYVTLAVAMGYAEHGRKIIEQDGKPTWVEHPDWHTPSWLSVDEFEAALTAESEWPPNDEYWAVLAAMKCLRERGNEVRIVFWFDN